MLVFLVTKEYRDLLCYHLLLGNSNILGKYTLGENQSNFLVKYGSQSMTVVAVLKNCNNS